MGWLKGYPIIDECKLHEKEGRAVGVNFVLLPGKQEGCADRAVRLLTMHVLTHHRTSVTLKVHYWTIRVFELHLISSISYLRMRLMACSLTPNCTTSR